MIALQQEQKAPNPRPIYPSAQVYYSDYYSEKKESTFRIVKDSWENIRRSSNLSQKLTETDLKLISLISALIKHTPLGHAYFSLDYLCAKLGITDRQLRTVRKNIAHIFSSRWRKCIKIDGALKKNVYVFAYTLQGRDLLGASEKYYESVKVGSPLPTSIYKDENYIKEDRSSESTFCKDSNSSRAKLYKFKQYDEPKSLGEHYPLTAEDCSELQSRSGRDFTQNAMNEILLDMSKKLKESKLKFPSKAAFMAYMKKVFIHEKRDAVKTANTGFKILARATEAEVIAYTSQAQRDDFTATFEEISIKFPTPENIFKTKIACTLPPMIGYNFLSNLRTVCKVGDIFEVHMSQDVLLTNHSRGLILSAANAVGGYRGVEKLEFIVEQKEVTKHAN